MNQRRVVITGMGALTPLGNDVSTYWENLKKGQSGAGPITKFDPTHFKTKFACELKGLNFEDFFDKKEIRKNDPFTLLALLSSKEAMEDSGINLEETDLRRFGVIWASGNGGFSTFEKEVEAFAQQGSTTPRFNPFFIPKILVDTPAGSISIKYGLMGINFCTVSACASSSTAIIDAFNYIRWGKVDLMVTGGSESPITRAGIGGFNAMKALSTRNDDPQAASRPFDNDRDGFVMGEGSASLILESYEHAKARGAKIYAEIVGGGMSADAYHPTATHPEGLGAKWGMEQALDDAGIKPDDIDYINMHATSTKLGDASELKAIESLFGNSLDKLRVSATKSMTGHLLGAAGGIEAIASIMAVRENTIPPTINLNTVDPDINTNINLTPLKAASHEIKYALSNTFGFGGHNASIIFKAFEE